MSYDTIFPEIYDVIVIGAGHAGIEAALSASRMGMQTLLFSINLDSIGLMPCNPSVGGIAKGHLVREIDALGGEIGLNTDITGIQFRMLNTKKGPSVQAPRVQSDKKWYSQRMKLILEQQKNLDIMQDIVEELVVKNQIIQGVITRRKVFYKSKTVILTAGTFLKGLIHVGLVHYSAGRADEFSAEKLSKSLQTHGIQLGRLKTGTPARILKSSIDFSKMKIQEGDKNPTPFSYRTDKITNQQVPCYLTHTTVSTKHIVLANLNRSPLYGDNKIIKGTGVRYCPSLEDKIVKFSEKEQHHVFIEPEGYNTEEMYVNGTSNSLPEDVQYDLLQSIPGLENVKISRMAYAIEYDYAYPSQLSYNFESKKIQNFFLAGQVNGTSGYEEAAAQGIMAGINAALKIKKQKPFILSRSEAYMGILIDDLVTKKIDEPYRMFTSRAEHRLLLRFDNGDLRLMPYGHKFGLISDNLYETMKEKYKIIDRLIVNLNQKFLSPKELTKYFPKKNMTYNKKFSIEHLLKNPEFTLKELEPFIPEIQTYSHDIKTSLEINIKYQGYIKRQMLEIKKIKKYEHLTIPENFDYNSIEQISFEAREKLNQIRPQTLSQASRISALRDSDLTLLYLHITQKIK